MDFIEYLGNLCVAMDNKQYKVRNVNIMEIGNHGVLELTVISRHDDIIIGRMGSYDYLIILAYILIHFNYSLLP